MQLYPALIICYTRCHFTVKSRVKLTQHIVYIVLDGHWPLAPHQDGADRASDRLHRRVRFLNQKSHAHRTLRAALCRQARQSYALIGVGWA